MLGRNCVCSVAARVVGHACSRVAGSPASVLTASSHHLPGHASACLGRPTPSTLLPNRRVQGGKAQPRRKQSQKDLKQAASANGQLSS